MFFVFDSLQCQERLQMKALTESSYLMLIHFVNCLYIGQKDEQLVFDWSLV